MFRSLWPTYHSLRYFLTAGRSTLRWSGSSTSWLGPLRLFCSPCGDFRCWPSRWLPGRPFSHQYQSVYSSSSLPNVYAGRLKATLTSYSLESWLINSFLGVCPFLYSLSLKWVSWSRKALLKGLRSHYCHWMSRHWNRKESSSALTVALVSSYQIFWPCATPSPSSPASTCGSVFSELWPFLFQTAFAFQFSLA